MIYLFTSYVVLAFFIACQSKFAFLPSVKTNVNYISGVALTFPFFTFDRKELNHESLFEAVDLYNSVDRFLLQSAERRHDVKILEISVEITTVNIIS